MRLSHRARRGMLQKRFYDLGYGLDMPLNIRFPMPRFCFFYGQYDDAWKDVLPCTRSWLSKGESGFRQTCDAYLSGLAVGSRTTVMRNLWES